MRHYYVDGRRIVSERSLYAEFARAVQAPGGYFGRRLCGFDDCLFGGFGLESPAVVHWEHADESRHALNCGALVAAIRRQPRFFQNKTALREAKAGQLSLFDYVVDAITSVSVRGSKDLCLVLE